MTSDELSKQTVQIWQTICDVMDHFHISDKRLFIHPELSKPEREAYGHLETAARAMLKARCSIRETAKAETE